VGLEGGVVWNVTGVFPQSGTGFHIIKVFLLETDV